MIKKKTNKILYLNKKIVSLYYENIIKNGIRKYY